MISTVVFLSLQQMIWFYHMDVLPPIDNSWCYNNLTFDLLIVPRLRHAWQGWLFFDYSVQVCESAVPAILIAVAGTWTAETLPIFHRQDALQENKNIVYSKEKNPISRYKAWLGWMVAFGKI